MMISKVLESLHPLVPAIQKMYCPVPYSNRQAANFDVHWLEHWNQLCGKNKKREFTSGGFWVEVE